MNRDCTEQSEETRRSTNHTDPLGGLFSGQGPVDIREDRRPIEALLCGHVLLVFDQGDTIPLNSFGRSPLEDEPQAFLLRIGKGLEQKYVEHAEDRRRCPDP